MRFIDLLEGSATADQAKQMGLVYGGYGKWNDPQTGQTVAKSVNGQLVKIDPNAPKEPAKKAEPAALPQPARTPDTGKHAADDDMDSTHRKFLDTPGFDPNHVDQDFIRKMTEPDDDDDSVDIAPQMEKGLGRLLGAAGGDVNKLRKILAKRYHAAGENLEQKAKAVMWIGKLDQYEKDMDAKADQAIQAAAAKKASDLQARKAKYPNPNKDL